MKYLRDKNFMLSLALSIGMLLAALVVQYYAGTYAAESASNPVTDVILSNTRVWDFDGIFIYGPFIFWAIMIIVSLSKPERFPFALKSIALFVLIRSLFVSLTHIGPFPARDILPDHNIIRDFTFGSDLFFSGHTGLPFLMALIFWHRKWLRWFCLASSVFFGIVVLLGHLHYSIDVLSAFFITYTIYHLALWLFPSDKKIFDRALSVSA